MMPFTPPLNPAKKCGSINPVMIRRSASTMCLLSSAGVPSAVRVFRLVIEYAVVGDDFRREHCLQFLPRVGPVRAELVQ